MARDAPFSKVKTHGTWEVLVNHFARKRNADDFVINLGRY
jgi:hypothetical protein